MLLLTLLEIDVINKSIKFFALLLLTLNVFAGGDDRDQVYYENLDEELAAFEAELAAEAAAQQMQSEINSEQERAAAIAARMEELAVEKEIAALEAALTAEAAATEMMAEIEREMALADFLQKLEDEKAAAAAATAAYRASLEEEVIGELEVEGEVIEVTEAAHEACKHALGLTEANIALFESSLADGTLFNKGPQSSNGTEFGASRWDDYANCVSNYVNPF